jgi:hypothetical protein
MYVLFFKRESIFQGVLDLHDPCNETTLSRSVLCTEDPMENLGDCGLLPNQWSSVQARPLALGAGQAFFICVDIYLPEGSHEL